MLPCIYTCVVGYRYNLQIMADPRVCPHLPYGSLPLSEGLLPLGLVVYMQAVARVVNPIHVQVIWTLALQIIVAEA